MTYNLKERIEELKRVRAIMEEDAEKYFRLNYPNIANSFLNSSKEITFTIYEILSKGGRN